jgi:hypothetical protein
VRTLEGSRVQHARLLVVYRSGTVVGHRLHLIRSQHHRSGMHHLSPNAWRRIALLLLLGPVWKMGHAQVAAIGLSTGLLTGDDAKALAPRMASSAELLPIVKYGPLEVGAVKAGLLFCAGFQFEEISFRDPLVFSSSALATTVAVDDTSGRAYTRGLFGTGSSLHATRIVLPVKAIVPFGKGKRWWACFGVQPRFLLGGKFRRAYRADGDKTVVRHRLYDAPENFHMNTIDVQLSGALAYGNIELSGKYSLAPLFRAGEGPDVHFAQVGLMVYIGARLW